MKGLRCSFFCQAERTGARFKCHSYSGKCVYNHDVEKKVSIKPAVKYVTMSVIYTRNYHDILHYSKQFRSVTLTREESLTSKLRHHKLIQRSAASPLTVDAV